MVATRPVDVNGLGWSLEQTQTTIEQLLEQFPLVEETAAVFPAWLDLVTRHEVRGKRSHDARIVASMVVSGISHVLTLNPNDFRGLAGVETIHPREVVNGRSF